MLRTAFEFFTFKPRQEETIPMVLMRFDMQCDKVSEAAGFQISYEVRSFLFMCILPLTQIKWSEYLKECGHRMPRNAAEYQAMQEHIVREKTLEAEMSQLGTGPKAKGQHHSFQNPLPKPSRGFQPPDWQHLVPSECQFLQGCRLSKSISHAPMNWSHTNTVNGP